MVLDGFALNPGDLDWSPLEALGECAVHDRTGAGQVVDRAGDASVLLTNKTPLAGSSLARLPRVRYIGVLATGYNVVDIPAATSRGVVVANVPGYGTASVAQMVFAHILEWAQQVALHDRSVRRGDWASCPDFCYLKAPLVELSGLVLGVVGYGRIGRAVARLGRAFGMEVAAAARRRPGEEEEGIRFLDADALLACSDVVSLHCPLTPATRRLIGPRALSLMKPTAFLVNTGRGELVDEEALARALGEGRLAGAGLDVLGREPPSEPSPLLSAPNCRITPHIAWATTAARSRLMDIAVDNLRGFLQGEPRNVVNPEVLERGGRPLRRAGSVRGRRG